MNLNDKTLNVRMQVLSFDDDLAYGGDRSFAAFPGFITHPVTSLSNHTFEVEPVLVYM